MEDESTAEQAAQENTAPAGGEKAQEQTQDQAPEQKTPQEQPKGQPKEGPAAQNQDAAGKPGEYQITLPEGISISQPMLDGFVATAKEAGIPQEQAQKLAGWYVGQATEQQKALDQQLEKQAEGWRNACRDDQEFGGARFDESRATIAKARDQFATPEMIKLLEDSGLGDHPEMNRLFYRVGKAISEDKTVGGAPPKQDPLKAAYSKSWDQMTK